MRTKKPSSGHVPRFLAAALALTAGCADGSEDVEVAAIRVELQAGASAPEPEQDSATRRLDPRMLEAIIRELGTSGEARDPDTGAYVSTNSRGASVVTTRTEIDEDTELWLCDGHECTQPPVAYLCWFSLHICKCYNILDCMLMHFSSVCVPNPNGPTAQSCQCVNSDCTLPAQD